MSRADELTLLARERRAATEQALLNRAVRNHKGPVDRVITKLVMTQIPNVPDEQVGGAAGQRGRLDAPPKGS
ncbi:MAG: hypothetical protein JWM31_2383 [Solirubrobacterales bacterium]|nr:hypothetical protein [Solirubrobacterales bacterium]